MREIKTIVARVMDGETASFDSTCASMDDAGWKPWGCSGVTLDNDGRVVLVQQMIRGGDDDDDDDD